MKKILYVGYRDISHSSAGGYDGIIENPETDRLMGENVLFGNIEVSQRGKILNVLVLDIISRVKRFKYDVVHYFYGDTMFVPYIKFKKHKTIATIHLNVEDNHRKRTAFFRALKSLDGIVVLSSNQKRLLKEKYGIESEFIPHGFNKPKFVKEDTGLDKKLVNICVLGQNYRDYDTMERIIMYCLKHRNDIRFHLIGQPQRIKEKYFNISNVVVYQRLPDNKYFSIIEECDYSFLPLTFATANNALLEAGFLGVTSILPKISGVEDYGAPKPLNLYYSNFDEAVNLFKGLKKHSKSDELIEFCEKNFLWDSVYKKLNEYYNAL